MKVTFWGVRGSIASPGPDTSQVGGNTSCVEVSHAETLVVLDAGTGIRKLGEQLMARGGPLKITLMLSHLHWDHIQGLPFFLPLYRGDSEVQILGPCNPHGSLLQVLSTQMTGPTFPVRFSELPARVRVRELRPGERFELGPLSIRTARTNHPGGGLAYRLEAQGRSVVYATDTEHYACLDPVLASLAGGCDSLIYDSQYSPEEYRGERGGSKVGWGHSTFEAGAELARACGAGDYWMFHHDPQRSDEQVALLERRAQALFARSLAAREGQSLELRSVDRAA
jgi:phosphoribosyl 1,2-cyclic phosphodiesterase